MKALIKNLYAKIDIKVYETILVWIFLIMTALSGLAVYSGDSTLSGDFTKNIIRLALYGLALLTFILHFLCKNKITVYVFLPIIYWVVTHAHVYAGFSMSLLFLMLMISFMMTSDEQKARIFNLYKYFLLAMCVVGIICYFTYIFSLGIPYKIKPYYVQSDSVSYVDFGAAYLFKEIENIRLCGLFNEPGYFGTILALVLCADKFNLKKISTYVFVFAGILTFSLAFIVISLLYLVLFCLKDKRLRIVIVLLALAYLFVLPRLHFANDELNKLIKRLSFTKDGLMGDNRTTDRYDRIFSKWLHGDKLLFGNGHGYKDYALMSDTGGNSSYKNYFLDYGIVGFVMIIGSLLIASLKKAKWNYSAIILIICFFASIYQRPYVFLLPYFTILFGGIEYVRLGCKKAEKDGNGVC